MVAMKPVEGMTCKYYDENCVLEVKIISYQEFTNKELIGLRVLKNLSQKPGCSHDEGDTFLYERNKNFVGNGIEGLILDP